MNIRLGLCSAYSFLYGVHKPEALLDRAQQLGIQTVSICDHNNLYGVHTFLEAARERKIRPIIGAALSLPKVERSSLPPTEIYCFVENKTGYARLCELLTQRNKDKEQFNPLPLLAHNAAGLVLATADTAALETLTGRVKNLYGAVHPNNSGAAGPSRTYGLPLCFLDNSLFLDKPDYIVHKTLRAIGLLKTVGSLAPQDTADKKRILRTTADLQYYLSSWPQAIQGTRKIAEQCQYNELFDGWIFPGYTNTALPPADELRNRVYEGAAARYGELGDRELERIEYELNIIEEKGFSAYFLTIDDIVKISNNLNGSRRTCGRGSGAASIVSYSLGITNVDPIAYNLYFERFLNPARADPPDLDIDFAWDERDDLIKAVINRFGTDHCARVANHNFFRYRGALRETAKAYGFGDTEIKQMERRITLGGRSEEGEVRKESGLPPTSSPLPPPSSLPPTFITDDVWREILTVAQKIEGLPHGLGMHCGGLVITPEPIHNHAPVEKSAEGYPLLAWEKEGAEAAGFVKIDLLGNRSLAVIRDTITNLAEQGITIDRDRWRPNDDTETITALAQGNSIGVFYIESPAMRQLQKKTNAGDFEHIVIHSSIIRPAANKFINEYVRRLKGGAWKPLHPRLEKILNETYGILCYQEDVSKTAVALANFNEADADKLRKVIAKKAGGAKLAPYQKQFFDGCRTNGVAAETTQQIWEMMLSFDGYSFCKPHSASYAMVSFQSAYLRVHHPAEFMAAVLSNQGGYYRPHAYISESRRMGLFTQGPDINNSKWKYYGKGRDIYIGLMAIKGLSKSGAERILAEREQNGDYISLDEFTRRVRLNRDDITALCPAGVFDSIAKGIPRTAQARTLLGTIAGTTAGQTELFAAERQPEYSAIIAPPPTPAKPPKQTETEQWNEYHALGFLRKLHPLALWKTAVLAIPNRVKALHIAKYEGYHIKMAGWPVTQKDVWTKDGLAMSFLSLEDETALYETVIFPQIYDKYSKLLFDQQPLIIWGKVVVDEGAISLEVQKIAVFGR